MTLAQLKVDECAIITEIGNLKPRLLEMGLIPGTAIRFIKKTPFGGPIEVKVRDFYLSIRLKDANLIIVTL
ncbi:ferrous iron transport protein A [Marine Group I thaumarchaeote]|uniref:Ferrous iron transport protein A n=1 Tax=Marine Group I thaumarchaeote TaxID=2511932 RepID=A0A7K4MMD4_9ARCH|nr:ferrous iron transport protein A [Marine Group I thaumarchaeote]